MTLYVVEINVTCGFDSFSVHLTSASGGGATLAAGGDRGTITILDDDNKPTFNVDSQTVPEPAAGTSGVMAFTISLSNASATPIKLNYATADTDLANNTAVPGVNYTSTSGSVTIPPNAVLVFERDFGLWPVLIEQRDRERFVACERAAGERSTRILSLVTRPSVD